MIRWGEQHLLTNKNFCGCFPKVWDNVPLAGEWAIRVLDLAEHVFGVYVAHDMFLVLLLSCLDAYYPTRDDKLHYLAMGPAGTSKVRALRLRFAHDWSLVSL